MVRKVIIAGLALVLLTALFAAASSALDHSRPVSTKPNLDNVRAYAPAAEPQGLSYAVDGGVLYAGGEGSWSQVPTPEGVIVGAIAASAGDPELLYMGAANALVLYRSTDGGATWMPIPLAEEVGGVTALAVDESLRTIYVGTDSAGLFRLRDVGSSVVLNAHLLLNEPVIEVAAGGGLAFARSQWNLYRGEHGGLRWVTVDNLGSVPTALALTTGAKSTVYVGTVDRGLLKSVDGLTWTTASVGLGGGPGTRLQIDALTADPLQPNVLYAASSYLFGSTTVHQSPVAVSMSTNGGEAWTALAPLADVPVAALLPASGQTGAVYALMANSRTPLALGRQPELAPLASTSLPAATSTGGRWIAWGVAALAAVALLFAVASDLLARRRTVVPSPLAPQPAAVQ